MVDAEGLPEESQKKGVWRTLTTGENVFQPLVEPGIKPAIGSAWVSRHEYDGKHSSGVVTLVVPAFYSHGLEKHNPTTVIIAGCDLAGFCGTFAYSLNDFFRLHRPDDYRVVEEFEEFYKEFYGEEA